MSVSNVTRVLETVADVAAERDLANVRRSLLQSVAELLNTDGVAFCSLSSEESEQREAPFHIRLNPDSRAQLAEGQPVLIEVDAGAPVRLFPVSRDEALAVRLMGSAANGDEGRVIQALVRLYVNFKELLAASEQDRLTGLLNRRSFDAQLARIAETVMHGQPVEAPCAECPDGKSVLHYWLALLDVDHFKSINDRYGHLFGDEVLLLLARLLRQCFRGEDRCFRYGGEEFAVILAPTTQPGAVKALERLRRLVEVYAFPRIGQVTISVGCAAMTPGLGAMDVIDRADRALYDAKNGGRNRLVCAPLPGTAGDAPGQPAYGEVELF
ncbi:GGDEF domain-containing protein [Fontimonas sp. SYSU GA230001]|uniref:GGDEF domain-containing protein n=1 Tax=Fontimonas sp. SYSU GA230001 TaxID=3142450 RepID=UPI0032B60BA7